MSAPAVEAFPAVPASSTAPNVAPPAPAAPVQPWAAGTDAYQMPSAMPPGAPGMPMPGVVPGHDASGAPVHVAYDPYHYMMMGGVVDDNAPPPPPPPPDAGMGPPGAPGMSAGSGDSGTHTCDRCPREFTSKRGLTLHMRTHSEVKPLQCQSCHQRFATSKALLDHRRLHEAEQPFRCSLCPKSFGTRKGLDIHLAVHEGNLSYKCNRCLKQFSNSSSLAAHISRCNSVEKTSFLCKICGVPVGKRGRKAHMSIHAQCASCKQWFAKDSDLKLHIATHPVCFPCTVCDAVFEDRDKLEGHMQCHRPTGASPTFDCDVCGQSYANKFGLKSHQISSGHELQTTLDPNIPPPPQPGAMVAAASMHMAAAAAAAGWPAAAIPGAPPPPFGGMATPGAGGAGAEAPVVSVQAHASSSSAAASSSSARRRSSRSPSSSPPPPPPPGSDGEISPESKFAQPSKKRSRGDSVVGDTSGSVGTGDSSAVSADAVSQYPSDQNAGENAQHIPNGTASISHDGADVGAPGGVDQPSKRQRVSDEDQPVA